MIRILPKDVSDKIAAGEVVDRPVSVLKELVENSIDAGARTVTAEIKDGGKTYLRVTDDGSGIPSEQVALAFQRHATSKISVAEDLDQIRTLGFRGEALASIAAVSRIEIITKNSSAKAGTRTILEAGEVKSQSLIGCPDGTSIIVRDLFFNTPARLKFLKNDGIETSLAVDCFGQMALANPQIRFRMIQQGRTLFSTTGDGDMMRAIQTLFDGLRGIAMIQVSENQPGMRLKGVISDPGESRPNRKYQLFFVNGRIVSSRLLEKAVDTAYGRRIPDGRHPVSFLFLDVPPENLDVNIHPNKREVRFHEEKKLQAFVTDSLSAALNQPAAIPSLTGGPSKGVDSAWKIHAVSPENSDRPEDIPKEKHAPEPQIDIINILSTIREKSVAANEYHGISDTDEQGSPVAVNAVSLELSKIEILGTVFETYIIGATQDQLYLIDQHAAHERILYEEILGNFRNQEGFSQGLMVPFTIAGGPGEGDPEGIWMSFLKNSGFVLENFGPRIYLVHGVPGMMTLGVAEAFLKDFIDQMPEESASMDERTLERAAARACKAAVKARDVLSREEIAQLLLRLQSCENPYACPHGRPVFIRIGKDEIQRKFRRT